MYDPKRLKTIDECRTVLARAKAVGKHDVYDAVFRRLCQIGGNDRDDPDDPLVRDFHGALAAYEQLLTEKNGKKTRASYTRRSMNNKGIHQSVLEWANEKTEKEGFTLLIDMGMPEFTAEYLVSRYPNRFPADVVCRANERLTAHGVSLPSVVV
jgi:hypothetical protein